MNCLHTFMTNYQVRLPNLRCSAKMTHGSVITMGQRSNDFISLNDRVFQ